MLDFPPIDNRHTRSKVIDSGGTAQGYSLCLAHMRSIPNRHRTLLPGCGEAS